MTIENPMQFTNAPLFLESVIIHPSFYLIQLCNKRLMNDFNGIFEEND